MISHIQLKANQESAKLGGVKTAEGKEISKFNALKHGILRELLTDYENDSYLEIYAEFVAEYQPSSITEQVLVERIATYYLKLVRVQKAEREFMEERLNPRTVVSTGFPNINEAIMKPEVVNEGYTAKITSEDVQQLMGTYSRYEVLLENRLYRAIHELERIQRQRKGEFVAPPISVEIGEMGSFGEKD